MGKNLAQAPLTAIAFASIWYFSVPFFSSLSSESYKEALAGFNMPVLGYAFMVVYGLWLSIILALIFSSARGKGVVLTVLMAIPMLFTQWVAPTIRQIVFWDAASQMTQRDLIFWLVEGVIATIFLLMLALLLFKPPHVHEPPRQPNAPPKKPDKYRLRKRNFVVTLIVLPVIYMVIFFLTWYFLLLGNAAAREFYVAGADTDTFAKYLVDMLMNDNRQMPMALIKGLLYALPLIPLMFELAHRRAMFIITSVMLMLGPALRMLVPSAVIPDAVRIAHLIEMSATAVVFGALTAFMMHMCVFREASSASPAAAAKGKRPGAAAGGAAAPPAAKT